MVVLNHLTPTQRRVYIIADNRLAELVGWDTDLLASDASGGRMSLTYFSVCSGIEAASVAWEPLGFKPLAFSEIEPFPCEVLQHHYPHIPNLGDMTAIDGAVFRGKADILVATCGSVWAAHRVRRFRRWGCAAGWLMIEEIFHLRKH